MEAAESELKSPGSASPRAGFTLVEVMIGASLSLILLGAIIAAFLFFCETGVAMANYHEMESDSQALLQTFARDVRNAESASWTNAHRVVLTAAGQATTYAFNAAEGTFTRTLPDGTVQQLASSIAAFSFRAYSLEGVELSLAANLANASAATKMVQVTAQLERDVTTGPDSHGNIVSSRYMLRNKLIP